MLDPKAKAKGSVTLTAYDVPADTSAALTLGTQATGTTTVPGQRNNFTFSGAQNQRVSVSVDSSDFSGTISLLKPDLSVLASTPVGPAGGFLDTTVLPVAGTYTFVDRPERRRHGIALSFTAYDVPADPLVRDHRGRTGRRPSPPPFRARTPTRRSPAPRARRSASSFRTSSTSTPPSSIS